jgi:hypothetical protein
VTQGSIFLGLLVFIVCCVIAYRAEERSGDPWYGGTVMILGTIAAYATAATLG